MDVAQRRRYRVSHPYTVRVDTEYGTDKGQLRPRRLPTRTRIWSGKSPKWLSSSMDGCSIADVWVQLQSHLLIKHLIKSLPTHPLLIPIAPHTSQSVFDPRHLRPWGRRELVETMKRICTKWGFWEEATEDGRPDQGGVSMLSHSNGSVGHAWRE